MRPLLAIALLSIVSMAQVRIPGPGGSTPTGGGGVTWTLISSTSDFTSTNNSAAVNYTSTAGNLIVITGVVFQNGGDPTFSSCTGDSPTHASGAFISFNYVATFWLGTDSCYVLSSSGGLKTYDITFAGGVNTGIIVAEYHRSTGTATFDTAGTSNNSGSACSNCVAPTLTLSGSSDVIIQSSTSRNGCNAISGAYSNPFITDLTNTDGAFAGALTQSSGSGPTWTCTSGEIVMSSLAFK
jgi:hypothetical protein